MWTPLARQDYAQLMVIGLTLVKQLASSRCFSFMYVMCDFKSILYTTKHLSAALHMALYSEVKHDILG